MDMCVIAALDLTSLGSTLWVILQVIVGLGFVIFVHELGHFAVAKACGVKCPKFYVGFDVPLGRMINKLFGREGDRVFGIPIPRTIGPRVQIGETEYGIGILPLGGYVRMLGQDDDPANVEQQLKESEVAGNAVDAKEVLGPDGKVYRIDRRSYMAKSVPQRMAIISAGVTMNIIFAFIFAVIAYKIGVPYNPSIVSQTGPGSPAWQAGIRPGDEVVKIADVEQPSYDDLRGSVMLGDLENGIPFQIRRGSETLDLQLFPRQGSGLPRVGIGQPASLRLPSELPPRLLEFVKSSAPLMAGDEIVAVDGEAVTSYAEYSAVLTRAPEKPVVIRVRRGGKPPADDAFGPLSGGEMVDITVNPRPVKALGLVMEMGPVTAVQVDSPAAGKIKPGDQIEALAKAGEDGELAFDPVTLPDDLRRMAEDGGDVELTLRRKSTADGKLQDAESLSLPLRRVEWAEGSLGGNENDPIVTTALGVAYAVSSVVDRVEPGSPAEKAGLKSGDVVTNAEFVYPEDFDDDLKLDPVVFRNDEGEPQPNWPALVASLQLLPESAQVKLTYHRGKEEQTAMLTPAASTTYFTAEHGLYMFVFDPIKRIRIAKNWSEAVDRGWNETVGALGMVYRFLGKLGSQVPITGLGGPVTIFKAAGATAAEGPGKLLVFLTMLSANLAVINFLPIPLLDGGHMVFLLWEGIRGKPAGEKFVMTMHTAGLVFLITLMLFVLSLDFGLIPRNL